MEKYCYKEEKKRVMEFFKITELISLTAVFLITYLIFMVTIALGIACLIDDKNLIDLKVCGIAFGASAFGLFVIMIIEKLQFRDNDILKVQLNTAAGIVTVLAVLLMGILLLMDRQCFWNQSLAWIVYPNIFLIVANGLLMFVARTK